MPAMASGSNDHRGEILYFAIKIDVSLWQLYFYEVLSTHIIVT